MLQGSIGLMIRLGRTVITSEETYKTSNGKIKVNDRTYIETSEKLYRLRGFKLSGEAIIQEIWEDIETQTIRKGENEIISKKEMIQMLETSVKIVKGP